MSNNSHSVQTGFKTETTGAPAQANLDDAGLLKVNVVAGGSGGGGGAVTVADGADVAQGSTADSAWVSGAGTVIALLKKIASAGGSAVSVADGSDVNAGTTTDVAVVTDINGTLSGKLRGLVKIFADVWDSASHFLKVSIQNATLAVTQSGTWTVQPGNTANTTAWKTDGSGVTQPVSATSLPLPSGAATGAKQDTGNASLASIDGKLTNPLSVSGPLTDTQLRATPVPVSGTVSTGGLTDTQLRATAVPISAVALPLPSGAATDGVLTGGTAKAIVRGGAQGATAAADITGTAQGADHQGLDVQIRTSAGAVVDSFGGTTPASTVTTVRVPPAWRQSVVLLAANASRKSGQITNNTDAPFYLSEGAGASDISFVALVPPFGRYLTEATVEYDGWWNVPPTSGWVVVVERT